MMGFHFVGLCSISFINGTQFLSPYSSTNAYMLIYRLKDPSRNASKS